MFAIMDAGTGGKGASDRACDQCQLRKVRCDMKQPCQPCFDRSFDCTFQRTRKKRGPAGKRIQTIRRHQDKVRRSGDPSDASQKSSSPGQHIDQIPRTVPYEIAEQQSELNCWDSGSVQDTPSQIDMDLMTPTQSLPSLALSTTRSLVQQDSWSAPPVDDWLQNEAWLPSLPIDSPNSASELFGGMLSQIETGSTDTQAKWPPSINEESLLPWIDVYFKRLHPTIPILDRTTMYQEMLTQKHRKDAQYGAMLLALCAFAMTQPIQIHEVAEAPSRSVQARMLIEECIRMRVIADFGEHPTLETILTSFFLFACLFGNGEHQAAWHRLREAIDLATSLSIHLFSSYESLDSMTRERWLRTYLVLAVTERAYALQQGRSIGFRGRISFNALFLQTSSLMQKADRRASVAQVLSHEPAEVFAFTGLLFLAESFDAFDETILECWNGHCRLSDGICETFDRRRALQMFQAQRRAHEACTTGQVSSLQNGRPLVFSDLPDSQKADIAVTQLWLLSKLWLLCRSHGLLIRTSTYPELRPDFACYIASACWSRCKTLPFPAMEVHGVGMAEKIFNIASGIVTALSIDQQTGLQTILAPPADSQILVEALDLDEEMPNILILLQSFSALLNAFRGGDHNYGHQLEALISSLGG